MVDWLVRKLKVALIGVYPPPYGGISVHIQRLSASYPDGGALVAVFDSGRQVKKTPGVYNLGRIRGWLCFLASRWDIVHAHTSSINWKVPIAFFFLARMKRTRFILSYHSLREKEEDFGSLGRRLVRFMLKSASHCIAINAEIKAKLVAMGAPPERVSVVPAFLPPVVKEEEVAGIPRETGDFIASHKPLIAANAYAIIKYQGQDLYGIDMCIDLCAALKKDYPRVGVLFCLPRIGDIPAFNELKRSIEEKGVADNFIFQTEPGQFYPVLMKSDIMVRPTNTDSYGVSVAEAICFRVPAIASDVCPRPEGTILFKSRDIEDFIARVKMVWENYSDYKTKLESLEMPDNLSEILGIYRRVAGRNTA
jgi:glycosyltransferase involved in cell wall biosynthesis